MAARGSKKSGKAPLPAEADPGFNAPFRQLVPSMRKRVKATSAPSPVAARERKTMPPQRTTQPADVSPSAPVAAVDETVDEAGIFAEATRDVTRIEPASRVRSTATSRFDRIAAGRRKELEEMAAAVGFDVAFHDHYVRGRADGVSRETLSTLEKGGFAVAAHLDLHGMVLEDAQAAVDEFLRDQQRRGHRCVLLITGKGKNSRGQQGVLREKVPGWLARGPSARRVLAFVSARACDGGVGALYVLMRANTSRKNRIDVEFGGVGTVEI